MPTDPVLRYCLECLRPTVAGRHYCERCRPYLAECVAQFREYMGTPGCGHLGVSDIAYYRELEMRIQEDNRERERTCTTG